MGDRPMASTSRAGRPRMRSVHLPTHIPITSKAAKPRVKSVYKAQVKGKVNSKKKLGKTAIVISSESTSRHSN